jgi:hypothetical protein
MGIETNIKEVIRRMQNKGWLIVGENQTSITLQNDILFTENVEISIPINKNDRSYPLLLESFLGILIQMDSDFINLPIIAKLFAQSKNIEHKFSKEKRKWILSEPGIKYDIEEIPDIYIPKL